MEIFFAVGTKLPFSELLLTADLGAHNPFELITLLALSSFTHNLYALAPWPATRY